MSKGELFLGYFMLISGGIVGGAMVCYSTYIAASWLVFDGPGSFVGLVSAAGFSALVCTMGVKGWRLLVPTQEHGHQKSSSDSQIPRGVVSVALAVGVWVGFSHAQDTQDEFNFYSDLNERSNAAKRNELILDANSSAFYPAKDVADRARKICVNVRLDRIREENRRSWRTKSDGG